jgi:sugar phosphate isomerase/epimerase
MAGGSAHPRISVNSICSMKQSLDADIALWAALGVDNVGLISPKLEACGWEVARRAVDDAGLLVSSVSCYKDGIAPSLEFSAAVGSGVLYIVTGSAGSTPWEEAALGFCEEMAPFVERGGELGVRLALEPTNPLRTDVSFVHCVRDAVDLARMAGTGVVVDFYSSWYERGLDELVRKNIDLVALVQISDYKLGTFDMPNRCAVGDGDIPVERLLGLLLDAGYEGPFDLEILGPRIEEEGYRSPIARSVERTTVMLDRLGTRGDEAT